VACDHSVLRGLDRLPPFSPILNRLLASLAREDASFGELAEVIEKDTVLAGNALRLVNSALYGFAGTVNSVATAVLSDLVAQRVPVPYPEGAFVAGLLHDVGKLLIAISLPREYVAIQTLFSRGTRALEECEQEVIGATHSVLSGVVLEKWNLPPPIRRAVTFHHSPQQADQGQLDLSHVVQAADRIALDLGHTLLPAGDGPPPAPGAMLEGLGLDSQMPGLLEQFHSEFEVLRTFF
jgi:HD-like signal output (HDOD) protein